MDLEINQVKERQIKSTCSYSVCILQSELLVTFNDVDINVSFKYSIFNITVH